MGIPVTPPEQRPLFSIMPLAQCDKCQGFGDSVPKGKERPNNRMNPKNACQEDQSLP